MSKLCPRAGGRWTLPAPSATMHCATLAQRGRRTGGSRPHPAVTPSCTAVSAAIDFRHIDWISWPGCFLRRGKSGTGPNTLLEAGMCIRTSCLSLTWSGPHAWEKASMWRLCRASRNCEAWLHACSLRSFVKAAPSSKRRGKRPLPLKTPGARIIHQKLPSSNGAFHGGNLYARLASKRAWHSPNSARFIWIIVAESLHKPRALHTCAAGGVWAQLSAAPEHQAHTAECHDPEATRALRSASASSKSVRSQAEASDAARRRASASSRFRQRCNV